MTAPRFALVAALALIGVAVLAAEGEAKPKMSFLPFPFVFSTPETGFGGGALLSVLGDFHPEIPNQMQDDYQAVALITVKHQTVFALQAEHYSPGNGLKLDADASYSNYPSTYYGIGGPSDGREEDYTSRSGSAYASLGFKLVPGLYLGPYIRWTGYSVEDKQDGGELERGEVEGSKGASVLLAGPRLTYEGRDAPQAATRGYYADASCYISPEVLGAKTAFSLAALDLRAYATPVKSFSAVLAGQVYMSTTLGEAPFQELPELGGDKKLRGYLDTEYMDKALAFAQVELRSPMLWRFGLAAFGGVGAIGPSLASLDFSDTRFAEGLGLRILLDKESGARIRIDMARGEGEPVMYFQFGEAF
jgi:outer membrane protein assembly factor BamA